MFKSKFVKETDILCEKPTKYRKLNSKYLHLYLEGPSSIEMSNVKEFALNNDKTIISCKISDVRVSDLLIAQYFYSAGTEELEIPFSNIIDESTGFPKEPYKSKDYEIIFENQEVFLNVLINNSEL